MLFLMKLFQIFIKNALYKKALWKNYFWKNYFFYKKKSIIAKTSMKMNIFFKCKIISCFLRKMTKNEKNRILLVFTSRAILEKLNVIFFKIFILSKKGIPSLFSS